MKIRTSNVVSIEMILELLSNYVIVLTEYDFFNCWKRFGFNSLCPAEILRKTKKKML